MEKKLSTMTIIVKDNESTDELNSVLYEFAPYIIEIMTHKEGKTSIISIGLNAPDDILSSLGKRIGDI